MHELPLAALLSMSLVACGGLEEDEAATETHSAAVCTIPPCDPPPGEVVQHKPDLVPEIASANACPVNNGQTVTVRVRNQGIVAAGPSVARIEAKYQGGAQIWTMVRYYRIAGLAPGASTTVGVDLGDGVNASAGNGSTTPSATMSFLNGVNFIGPISSWNIRVDTSFGPVYFPAAGGNVSYPVSVSEANEVNNQKSGYTWSCVP